MNNNILYSSLIFVVGAALGGVLGWSLTKKKYSELAQSEIDSVKEKFTIPKKDIVKKSREEKSENVSKKALNKPSLMEYTKKIKEQAYTNYATEEKPKEKTGHYPWEKNEDEDNKPYVISPDEFADGVDEKDDFEQVTLIFYADGILATDDGDEVINNVKEVVGDALDHIGDYEDDAIHVCNKKLKTFYEILVDERSYEKATGKDPHPDGDEED